MSDPSTGTPSAGGTGNIARLLQRLRGMLMFIDLPIRKKFLFFAGSILLWFCLMAAISVGSMTVIRYDYYQISENVVPYRQAIESVLARLQNLDRALRQIQSGRSSTGESFDVSYLSAQVQAIRATLIELRFNQSNKPNGDTLVEQVLQDMAKANPEGLQYMREMLALTDRIDHSLESLAAQAKRPAGQRAASPGALLAPVTEAEALSARQLASAALQYKGINQRIYQNIRGSVHTVIGLTVLASLLLVLFTNWIIVAFYRPIKLITNQIDSLSTGDIDLAKKMSITSKDEIGVMSRKFNSLMEAVHGMTIYKRGIEEDSSLEEVYHRLGEVFTNLLGIDNYTIYQVNSQQKEMRVTYPPLVGDRRLHCYEDILVDCNLCRAVGTGHNISSYEFGGVCRHFDPEQGGGHVCVPMVQGGNTCGVVQFRFQGGAGHASLSGEDATRLFKAETYINQSLSVIEAKRLMQTLQSSALVDPLTGLYNRRFLQEHTTQIINGVLRRGSLIGMLLCDLDYFKQVNDTHGHDVGDQMLKETSAILKSSVRESDLIIRFGGEEFLVLLLDIVPGHAAEVAEKIRAKVEQFRLRVGETVLQKSISIGISEFPIDTDGFWQAIKFADVAMYQAKETGRNRVVRFLPEMWQHDGF